MKEESFRAHLEIKYVYRIDASDVNKYRELKAHAPTGGFQGMFDKGDLKFLPPIITCRNVIDETAPIREQVTSVDLMRPQHGPDGYFVTLTGEYRMQCHETIRHEKFPFSRQALQVRLVCKQPMAKVMLAPYCVVAAEVQERGRDYTRSRWVARCAQTFFRTAAQTFFSQPPACIVGI